MPTPTERSLRGDAVVLRATTPADAPRLAEILAHPDVARWWGHWNRARVQRELLAPDDETVTLNGAMAS